MPKAKKTSGHRLSQTDLKIYYNMHSLHLFQTDETLPVNIPRKHKQFLIPGPVTVRQLISIST